MPIKAVIFDMDGVLIDAREWHYEALNNALNLFGFNISRHEHLFSYDGLPTKVKLEILSKEKNLPKGLHTFINTLKQKYTHELIQQKCKRVFQIQYLLMKLKSENFKLAVCSNSIKKTMDLMLTSANIANFLDFYLSAEDVSRPKPDPQIYIDAIKKIGLVSNQVLIVEDNINGIKAARKSGAFVLEVSDPSDVTYTAITEFFNNINNS